jgi:hypothetical protein
MYSATRIRETSNAGAASSAVRRLLLTSENREYLAVCARRLRSPGCKIPTCSGYVELLLYLQHEAFQLVIVFEGENAPPEWRAVVRQAAEAGDGTPVLVFRRPEELSRLTRMRPN